MGILQPDIRPNLNLVLIPPAVRASLNEVGNGKIMASDSAYKLKKYKINILD